MSCGRGEVGQVGERAAVAHLRRGGRRVVDRNFRTRMGELDIIALDGTTLTFCEVKTRVGNSGIQPVESVTHSKQQRIRGLACQWLAAKRQSGERLPYFREIRFDVVGVVLDGRRRVKTVELIEGAF